MSSVGFRGRRAPCQSSVQKCNFLLSGPLLYTAEWTLAVPCDTFALSILCSLTHHRPSPQAHGTFQGSNRLSLQPPLNKRRSEKVKCAGVQLSIREPHLSNQLSFILESVALQNGIGLINSPEPLEEKGPLIEWGCILI